MKFNRKYPSPALGSFVKSYWKLEIEACDLPFSQLYFPYGAFELIYYVKNSGLMQYVGCADGFYQRELFYSGQFTKPFFLHFDKPCICFGVSLQPWAGNVLFNVPSNEFTDKMIGLNDLDKDGLNIDSGQCDDLFFAELEKYLLKKAYSKNSDQVSCYIAQVLVNTPDRASANNVILKAGLSRRRIEQRFLEATGLCISGFTKKIRFQKSVQMLGNYNDQVLGLTEVGIAAGYYDQSHFIREFKEYTSLTPSSYLKQKSDLKNFLATLSKNENFQK